MSDYYTAGEIIDWMSLSRQGMSDSVFRNVGQRFSTSNLQQIGVSQTDVTLGLQNDTGITDPRELQDHILGAVAKNGEFVSKLLREVNKIVIVNKSRIGDPGTRFVDPVSKQVGILPTSFNEFMSNPTNTIKAMSGIAMTLLLLIDWGIITRETELPVRKIDIAKGSGKWSEGSIPETRYKMDPYTKRKRLVYDSFHACDIHTVATHGNTVYVISNLDMVSTSTHTDHSVLRKLGQPIDNRVVKNGYTTFAGTLLFSGTPDINIFGSWGKDAEHQMLKQDMSNFMPLPPLTLSDLPRGFDLILYATNEYGQAGMRLLIDIVVNDSSDTHGKNDSYSETQAMFRAGFITPWYYIEPGAAGIDADILGIMSDGRSPMFDLKAALGMGIIDPATLYDTKWKEYYNALDTSLLNN